MHTIAERWIATLYEFLKKNMPYDLYRAVSLINSNGKLGDKSIQYKRRYYIRKEKGAKEKYCIFRIPIPQHALLSAAKRYLFAYEWAKKKGYIPVLDLEYEYNFERGILGTENLWDQCFVQQVSVEEAIKKEWVMVMELDGYYAYLSKMALDINGDKRQANILTVETGWRAYYKKIYSYMKESMPIREELIKKAEGEIRSLWDSDSVVVGIFLRESFSTEMDLQNSGNQEIEKIYSRHPKTLGVKEIIPIVAEYIKKWKCDKIFLSTIMQSSIDMFKEFFGEKVVFLERKRRDSLTSNYPYNGTLKEKYEYSHKFEQETCYSLSEQSRDYLEEIIMLSRCDYGIFSKSSGASVALGLNAGEYKDICILPDFNNIKSY